MKVVQWCWWIERCKKWIRFGIADVFLKYNCLLLLSRGHKCIPYPPPCSLLVLPLATQLYNHSTYVMKFNCSKWWHKFCKAFCTILRFWNHNNMPYHLLCFTELKCLNFMVCCPENLQQWTLQCRKPLRCSESALSTVVDQISAIWERLPREGPTAR